MVATLRAWSTPVTAPVSTSAFLRALRSGATRLRGATLPCGRLGEEGQVRHVRPRVDDRDGRFAIAHLLEDAHRGIQADVTTADNEDARTLRGAHIRKYPAPSGAAFVRPVTSSWTPCATLRGHFLGPGEPSHSPPRLPVRLRTRTALLSSNDPWHAWVPARDFDFQTRTGASPAIQRATRRTGLRSHISDVADRSARRMAGSPCEEIHELSRRAPGAPRPRTPRRGSGAGAVSLAPG